MKNKILLRADDLGYSEGVNYGIEKSVKQGLIHNVGVMLNMPATLHGVALLKDEKIAFGQHTNICAGRPLVNPKLIPSITTEDGYFKSSQSYRETKQDFVVLEEVLLEIEAQYHRFLTLFGRKPDYFEGHAVASANFFKALQIFAKEKELTYSGFPTDFEGDVPAMKVNNTKVYVMMKSMNKEYHPKETFEKLVIHRHNDGVDMMIFHPGYIDGYLYQHSSLLTPRILEVDFLTSEYLKEVIQHQQLETLSYRDLI